jgi:hypothetical protein
MSLRASTASLLSGPYWYGFWIGFHHANRVSSIVSARNSNNEMVRKHFVSVARKYNKDLVREINNLRNYRGNSK